MSTFFGMTQIPGNLLLTIAHSIATTGEFVTASTYKFETHVHLVATGNPHQTVEAWCQPEPLWAVDYSPVSTTPLPCH